MKKVKGEKKKKMKSQKKYIYISKQKIFRTQKFQDSINFSVR